MGCGLEHDDCGRGGDAPGGGLVRGGDLRRPGRQRPNQPALVHRRHRLIARAPREGCSLYRMAVAVARLRHQPQRVTHRQRVRRRKHDHGRHRLRHGHGRATGYASGGRRDRGVGGGAGDVAEESPQASRASSNAGRIRPLPNLTIRTSRRWGCQLIRIRRVWHDSRAGIGNGRGHSLYGTISPRIVTATSGGCTIDGVRGAVRSGRPPPPRRRGSGRRTAAAAWKWETDLRGRSLEDVDREAEFGAVAEGGRRSAPGARD